MTYQPLPQPVSVSYNGDVLNVAMLRGFCETAERNFGVVAEEFHRVHARNAELAHNNAKLIQFMNWLAVTNPQILDEFQNTANAFDKLSPRDYGDEATACAAA